MRPPSHPLSHTLTLCLGRSGSREGALSVGRDNMSLLEAHCCDARGGAPGRGNGEVDEAPDWDGMMSVVGGPRNGKFDSGRKGEEAAGGTEG